MRRFLPLAALLLLAGCTVEALDLEDRQCPCVDGWTCETATNRCVRDDETEAGPGMDAGPGETDAGPGMDASPDGGADGGHGDSGETDSGAAEDAGPPADTGPPDDATPPDAFIPDASTDPCDGRLFCDDFETGDLSAWTTTDTVGTPPPTLAVTDERAHTGTYALRATAGVGGEFAAAYAEVIPAPTPRDIYFRGWYYIDGPGAEFEFHGFGDGTDLVQVIYLPSLATSNSHGHGYSGDYYETFSPGLPRNEWFCVETHLHLDETAGEIEVYFSDLRVMHLTARDTIPVRPITDVLAGIIYRDGENTDTHTLYTDDVAVSTSRIGCATP